MSTQISPWQLQAFRETLKCQSFSKAARELHITQPALTLRIKQLEECLGHKLIHRNRGNLLPTAQGQRLLEYIAIRERLDSELLEDIKREKDGQLIGTLRVAGHYSAIQHVAVPSLASLFLAHPGLQLEAIIKEDDEVPAILTAGQCDFALLQHALNLNAYLHEFLGYERYVLIRPTHRTTRHDTFIDSHPTDSITSDFFKQQRPGLQRHGYKRSFLYNESGILNAVENGLGMAVVAEQEIRSSSKVKVVAGYKALKLPLYLHYSKNIESSRMLALVRDALRRGVKRMLVQ
jgi:DNA-binding transcriptional LysR family regulator